MKPAQPCEFLVDFDPDKNALSVGIRVIRGHLKLVKFQFSPAS
jgi:hypothetical protein